MLASSLALRGEVEALGNLVQINAVLGQSGKAADLETQIAGVEQQVQRRLSALAAMSGDEAQVKAFDDKRSEMLETLKAAQGESSLSSKVAFFDKLLGQAQVLSKVIASQAGLSQDSDSAIRQLSELMTTVTAQVTQTLGEGRAIGSYSLGRALSIRRPAHASMTCCRNWKNSAPTTPSAWMKRWLPSPARKRGWAAWPAAARRRSSRPVN